MDTHGWNVTIREATEIQKNLQSSVRIAPLLRPPRTIAGADISMSRFSSDFKACIVVFSYPEMVEVERSFADLRVTFPYVSGYLSFREVPVLQLAYDKLQQKPDLIMMDGHGIAHPRRLGVATHLGLVLNCPTIGCAKSRLYGEGKEPGTDAGEYADLYDPRTGEVLGAYVRTKRNTKPVIISPGHLITLPEAIDITLHTVRGYRIPEPTRHAHGLVNKFRTGEIKE